MGDRIFSSLSAVSPRRVTNPTEQLNQSDPLHSSDDTHAVSFVDDVAVEVITVTDYAEVELGTSTDGEVVMSESLCEGTDTSTVAEDSLVLLPNKKNRGGEENTVEARGEQRQEKAASGLTNVIFPEENRDDFLSSQHRISKGRHDCPDCEKKFKFASSLIAHRVIHTGERPYRCNDCGRCFSFRQSLDRHRHTHKTGRKYNCAVCGETFQSVSARTLHKQTHMDDGVYTCHQCSKKFNGELALARHLKSHTDELNANKPTEGHTGGQEVVGDESVGKAPVTPAEPDNRGLTEDNGGGDPENAEVQSGECSTAEPEAAAPEFDDNLISPVKVRTSGRKRKPTMKIQVINLQKHMATKRRKIIKASSPELKPLPFNW